jgi:hypothetical protein
MHVSNSWVTVLDYELPLQQGARSHLCNVDGNALRCNLCSLLNLCGHPPGRVVSSSSQLDPWKVGKKTDVPSVWLKNSGEVIQVSRLHGTFSNPVPNTPASVCVGVSVIVLFDPQLVN